MSTQTPSPWSGSITPFRRALQILGALLAGYLVVRGVVELGTVDYGDPATYRQDWGGPSLLGVLAVHSGPGLAVLACCGYRLRRRAGRGR